jgi:hypothetical protein
MTTTPIKLPSGKAEFNLEEAAGLLGMSSAELSTLIAAQHQADGATKRDLTRLRFRPADLIMLSFSRLQSTADCALD